MQIHNMIYHFVPTRLKNMKSLAISSVGEDTEQWGHLNTAVGNGDLQATWGKIWASYRTFEEVNNL